MASRTSGIQPVLKVTQTVFLIVLFRRPHRRRCLGYGEMKMQDRLETAIYHHTHHLLFEMGLSLDRFPSNGKAEIFFFTNRKSTAFFKVVLLILREKGILTPYPVVIRYHLPDRVYHCISESAGYRSSRLTQRDCRSATTCRIDLQVVHLSGRNAEL